MPGQTRKNIQIPIKDDLLVEGRQEFWIDLTEAQNAMTILTSSVEVRIRDNDGVSTAALLEVDPAEVPEGAATEITVTGHPQQGSSRNGG